MKKKWWLPILILILGLILSGCGGNEPAPPGAQGGEDGPDHAHGDYEWIGEFELTAGEYLLHFGPSEDETMDIGFVKMGDNITDLEHHAAHLMVTEKDLIPQDGSFVAKPDYAFTLVMDPEHGHINFTIEEAGLYAIVTEHLPEESSMQIFDENDVELLPVKVHEIEGHSH